MDLHQLLDRFGAMIVFVNALLHELAVPIPLTPTVLLAAAVSPEVTAAAWVVLAVVVGTLIGNSVWFVAGRRFGPSVLRLLCRMSLSPDHCVAHAADGLARWGGALFIIGRFLPGVSLVAPPVAGAVGMSWPRFLWLTAAGAAVWALVIVVLGAALQKAVWAVVERLAVVPFGAWAAASAALLAWLAWRLAARRRARQSLAVPRIDPAGLHSALQSPQAPVVIDVRGRTMGEILGRRIPGAISLDLRELKERSLDFLRGRKAVLYCSCPNEASAARGALILRARGHADALALRGGLPAWIDAGYDFDPASGSKA